jgi:hypothetical protein
MNKFTLLLIAVVLGVVGCSLLMDATEEAVPLYPDKKVETFADHWVVDGKPVGIKILIMIPEGEYMYSRQPANGDYRIPLKVEINGRDKTPLRFENPVCPEKLEFQQEITVKYDELIPSDDGNYYIKIMGQVCDDAKGTCRIYRYNTVIAIL